MKFSQEVNKIDEIEDSNIEQLGSREDVVKTLGMIFPDADFRDPAWGTLDREGYSIEF
ncbi:hypothetical protein [Paenibacillus sanfengchensis]